MASTHLAFSVHRVAPESALARGRASLGRRFAPLFRFISSRTTGIALAVLVCGLVAVYTLWYTSAGRFPEFPAIQNDYIDLGDSFIHGQLSLLEQPDPRLAGLENPYDSKQRRQIPYHWDASYYHGRYYLYWGPVPAIVSAFIQGVLGEAPPASVLVLLPYLGLLGIFLALLLLVSQGFPSVVTHGSLWLFLIMGFLNLPLLFLIGQPRHYQASIIYGQFFLMAGLLCFFLYMMKPRPAWLLISSSAWGLALACRYNLAISVLVYMAFALIWLARDQAAARHWLRMVFLAIPLTLCLIGLGAYNLARFDNPLETGLTYQLTIPELRQVSYSVSYVPSNLYVYIAYPLIGAERFPFIQSPHFRLSSLPEWLSVPRGREFDQVIFGLARTVPALWLSVLAIPLLTLILRDVHSRRTLDPQRSQVNFLFVVALAAAAGQFAFLMLFFYAGERYVADFYLPLILCLAIILWRLDNGIRSMRPVRVVIWCAVALLTLWTAAVGYFACFGVPTLVGNYYDSAMLAHLASFWNKAYTGVHGLFNLFR